MFYRENGQFKSSYKADLQIFPILQENPLLIKVEIDRVNPPPTPMQFRLLCHMTVECDPLAATGRDFKPFAGEDYQPLSDKRSSMGIDCA